MARRTCALPYQALRVLASFLRCRLFDVVHDRVMGVGLSFVLSGEGHQNASRLLAGGPAISEPAEPHLLNAGARSAEPGVPMMR